MKKEYLMPRTIAVTIRSHKELLAGSIAINSSKSVDASQAASRGNSLWSDDEDDF